MKAIGWFLGGMVVGTVLVQASVAQDRARRGLNHIGIGTKNYESALAFYRDTLGAKEAFTIHNPDGTVRITYLQVSRDTFIELLPVAADQPGGILHVGIETDDLAASVASCASAASRSPIRRSVSRRRASRASPTSTA
jgi:hypothetical protein